MPAPPPSESPDMTFRHLETLPHAGLPGWQHHQFRADICRFHTLGGVLDFQQFTYTTTADGEAEYSFEQFLQTASVHSAEMVENIVRRI